MNRVLYIFVALAVCLFCPEQASAQKGKKGKTDLNPASAQDYAALNQNREVQAKLVSSDLASQTVSFGVEYQYLEPNGNFKPAAAGKGNTGQGNVNQRMLNFQRQLASAKTPQAKQRLLMQMQNEMAKMQQQYGKQPNQGNKNANNNGPFKQVTGVKDFELPISDKVATRRLNLPQEYDNKGNLKVFTKEEAAVLKGKDTTKPGYSAKFDDLVPGQTVKLYLTAAKTAPAKKAAKDDDDAFDIAPSSRPTVNMILIVNETPDPKILPPDTKKKKNK